MCLVDLGKLVCETQKEKLISEIKKWNQVEQVTFMIQSLDSLSLSMLKFITSICSQMLDTINVSDQANILGEQANSLGYFQLLKEQPLDKKVKTVISYLPLVDHTSHIKDQLRNLYFNLIIDVMETSLKLNMNLNECRYIVLLANYHPIFEPNQKLMYKKWADLLEKKILQQTNETSDCSNNNLKNQMVYIDVTKVDDHGLITDSSIESSYSNGTDSSEFTYSDYSQKIDESNSSLHSNLLNISNLSSRAHKPVTATSSLPPYSSLKPSENYESNYFKLGNKNNNFSTNSIISNDYGNSNENFHDFEKPKSSSNEFNETGEIKVNLNKNSGAKNIFYWLKNLRLHKYSEILCQLSYDDLLSLTDQKLMSHNVTLGARRKILANIDKLKRRNVKLDELIKGCDDVCVNKNNYEFKRLLDEMYEISQTPMKPQNSPPTSLADLSNIQNGTIDRFKNQENVTLCSKIIQFVQKAQVYIQNERVLLKTNDFLNADLGQEMTELVNLFLKIIDKLFLSKAFTDYQNTQLAKLRNSFNDRGDVSKQQSRSKSPAINVHNQSSNFLNARLRIQSKGIKNSLSRTSSAPYNQTIFDKYILVRDHNLNK